MMPGMGTPASIKGCRTAGCSRRGPGWRSPVPRSTRGAPGPWLDPTFGGFGSLGQVLVDIGASDSRANALGIQADGKLVVAGSAFQNADALVLAPGGKIVVVGSSTADTNFALARYNADGRLDTSFDGDGKVTTGFGGSASASAVALQTDGKLVVAGCGARAVGTANDFALARYNANGSLDATFGTGGQVTTGFGPGGDCANAVAMMALGVNRIVVAGSTYNGSHNDFALARYVGTTFLGSAPCCDFDGSGAIDAADIQFIAARWRWGQVDPLIDVVPDGRLTIQDVMSVIASTMLGAPVYASFPLWLTVALFVLIAAFTWRAYSSVTPYGWV